MAAVLIAIVIYSPEVVKVFGETFLAKRFAAGKEEGLEEGLVKGREEGVMKGRAEGVAKGLAEGVAKGRGELDAELLKFLEEHPEVTLDQVKDLLRSEASPRKGKAPVKGR